MYCTVRGAVWRIGLAVCATPHHVETLSIRRPPPAPRWFITNTKMLSRVASTAAKRAAPLAVRQTARSASAVALSGARVVPAAATIPAQQQLLNSAPTRRSLSAAAAEDTDHYLAAYAYEKSCYTDMDFTINEDDTMYNAVQKFSAFKVGSLVVVDGEGALRW